MATRFLSLYYIPDMLESAKLEGRSGFYISLLINSGTRDWAQLEPPADPGSSRLRVCPTSVSSEAI